MTAALKSITRAKAVLCTFGAQGAILRLEDDIFTEAAIPVQIVDRVGSGDAFAAGGLDGWLGGDMREGLRRGVALASIALSQHGDRVLTSRAEMNAVMTRQYQDINR